MQAVGQELMRRDVHPAEVTIDGSILVGVRAVVTSQRLLVYRADPSNRGVELAFEAELARPDEVEATRRQTLRSELKVELSDGSTAWINRGRGCGCGSPLKVMSPPVPWTLPRA